MRNLKLLFILYYLFFIIYDNSAQINLVENLSFEILDYFLGVWGGGEHQIV